LSKKIYVGNLPFEVTEDEVKSAFEVYGEVESIAMIMDRDTGKFRGFCFVEMADNDAGAAIEGLNDSDFGGRPMKVNEARPREDRGRGGGGRGGYGGGGGGYGGGRSRDNYGGGGRERRDRDNY